MKNMTKEVTKTIIREVTKIPRPSKRKKIQKEVKTYSASDSSKPKTIDKTIIENLIELQKIHVNLAEKFDKLSKQVSDLLTLFEMTARSFATNPNIQSSEKDKEFLEKIDKLLEQNKTIAKGLTLMEERVRERVYGQAPTNTLPQKPEIQTENEQLQPSIKDPNRPLSKF